MSCELDQLGLENQIPYLTGLYLPFKTHVLTQTGRHCTSGLTTQKTGIVTEELVRNITYIYP